jgi:hypothetical protein
MCNQNNIVNRYTVAFQLNEALEAIVATLHCASEGEYREFTDEWGFVVRLGDILDHLCLAWHRKRLGPHDVTKESQEEYELKTVSVPNWGERFRLVEIAALHPAIAPRLSRQKIDQDTIRTYLRAAEAALQNLMGKVESGQFDSCDVSLLGNEFEPILRNLCLAWHLRYLSGAEISSLDPTAIKELGWWLPPWQWNLRLIPSEEEMTGIPGEF